jgi:putative DNA primase/helicase
MKLPPSDEGAGDHRKPTPRLRNTTDPQALDPDTFPHPPRRGERTPGTIENMRHLLKSYGIEVRYDVIAKKLRITGDLWPSGLSNADETSMAYIVSLAALNRYPRDSVETYVAAIGDERPLNPVKDWMRSKPWDGIDRLTDICASVHETEDYPTQLKEVLVSKWLLSAVAAALLDGRFRTRGVLTLQGAQGIGKTTWVASLVPEQLRSAFVKLDHQLDAHNKDSILGAVAHWMVEIGELEGSLRKEVARLKGVITRDTDKVRKPYAKTETEMPRRTVFVATVNDANFLMDDTGNSRWWTISARSVDADHGVDMQQLFAQLAVELEGGAEWWLDAAEEAMLNQQNRKHRSISVVEDLLLQAFDLDRVGQPDLPALTPRELLVHLGIDRPTNPQFKECAGVLRTFVGESKRIQGRDKWRIPFTRECEREWKPRGLDKFD